MSAPVHRLFSSAIALFAAASPAAADDRVAAADDRSEVIVVEPAPTDGDDADADRALAEPELVTRIHVDASVPASANLAEVLARAAGAQVRGVGGLGGFASLSVRGLDAGHTPVLIDGVPLSRIATAGQDLSRFGLHSFGTVELYRGAVPPSLGEAGLGGALNLVTRVGPAPEGERGAVSAGLGSFGARHLRLRYLGGGGDLGYQIGAGYAGAKGDYDFYNDNGTNLNIDDDFIDRRRNNGFDRLDAVVRAVETRGDRTARGGARVALSRRGLPGVGSNQTDSARLESATGVLDAAVSRARLGGDKDLAGRFAGFAMFDREHLHDEDNEVGLGGGETLGETLSAGLGAALSRRGVRLPESSLSLDGRFDGFGERDPDSGEPGARGLRLGLAATAAVSVAAGTRSRIIGALRLEALETRPRRADTADLQPRSELTASPRIAALFRPDLDVSLKASAGYAVRHPTLIELFGDRGYLAGNPQIRAERGPAADLGAVWAPAAPPWLERLFAEAALFWSHPRDAIVYFPTAGQVVKPFNVGSASIRGLELTGSGARGPFEATASYTFLDARDADSGNRLPHRARHQLYARAAASHGRASLWLDLHLASGNFVDRAELIELPPRQLWGAGGRVRLGEHLTVSVEVKNLMNDIVESIALDPAPRPDLAEVPRAVSDFFGYPLPGRAYYAAAEATF